MLKRVHSLNINDFKVALPNAELHELAVLSSADSFQTGRQQIHSLQKRGTGMKNRVPQQCSAGFCRIIVLCSNVIHSLVDVT